MEQQGWIKLHRKLVDWEWYKDTNTFKLFIHLVLMANHKEQKWRGNTVKKGQLISGIASLSEATGLTEQSIRTSIKHLKSTGELTSQSTNRFTLYTLVNYEQYQTVTDNTEQQLTSQLTGNQQAANKQLTTNKNEKKEENEKNFISFWQAYPEKKDKKAAIKAFNKVAVELPTILAGLEKYKKHKESWKAWKNPASWLNGECWNDEYGTVQVSNRPDARKMMEAQNG